MRAVIIVVGKDSVGILGKVAGCCAEYQVNIIEVTQSILQDMFCMMMLVDATNSTIPFTQLADHLNTLGRELGLSIQAMHEDVFTSMHRI
nr:ACT domain-containing protein [bacterium]